MTLLHELGREVARSWWLFLLYGLLAIALAGFALFRPVETIGVWIIVLGALALAEGVLSLIAAWRASTVSRGWSILYGVLSLAFGLLAILRPQIVAFAGILLVAAWLLVAGVYRIVSAIRLRESIDGEWLLILSGVFAVLLGLLFAALPWLGLVALAVWIGIVALVYGVFQVVVAIRLRRLGRTGL
ncbi:HdeD family acid-resistance protein [Xanthomonas hortorum]|uniref:DUF308 domain-containing protein n=1 Tax=Xanthomonas hortorum pv. hederae TaxID=453603 RepID=A0A9X4BNX9_9XANT|nr:DUF308 domain-containing protein [Xanthomonas hortorum]MCE4369645.1 DUF308 domain-containing protein [Xanthomonas hortorum pv. hederae]MDC8637143.1 DUF308 domain-containing protein [Xanthomonas hortorum pv. hederae]PPU86188.1 hypothetical protein XhhCFBP4925_00190 [Xanthomonas hortorum pv. hederae]PUF01252.1 hypothetical protein C7T87_04160 [Xanthomonas hortorum pv. hederae]